MIDEGYSTNIIESVISTGFGNIVNSYYRVKAVEKFKKQKGFEELLVAFKRVCNIAKEKPQSDLNTKLFKHKSEKILYSSFNKIKKSSSNYIETSDGITKDSDYLKALSSIKTLKQPIDNFFDSVLVMEKDERIRNNRLALLNEVKELFFKISDFSKI